MTKIVDTNEQIILTYGFVGERFDKFKDMADKEGFRIISVDDKHTYCKVEDLIFERETDDINEDASPIEIEFLLFINIVNDDLYGFIAKLKEIGLYFPNKAILTQTNKDWILRRLLRENKEEHVVMTMFFNLRRAMKRAQSLVDQGKHDNDLLKLMEKAKHFMKPQEFDFDEMKHIHNSLASKVNELHAND